MIRFFSIILIFFNFLIVGSGKPDETENAKQQRHCIKSYPEVDTTCNEVTIPTLNATKEIKECLTVEGYVSYIYRCPPCPEGARCKPCASPHFSIHTNKEEDINKKTGRRYRITQTTIHANNTCSLELNKTYKFTVEQVRQQINLKGFSSID